VNDSTHRPGEELVLRLALRPGETLSGTVGPEDSRDGTEFSGWVELMAAIDAARSKRDEELP
jgi:hypothetical protein